MQTRTDIPASALPRRKGQLPRRTDIAASALPRRAGMLPRRTDIPNEAVRGGGIFSVITEALGQLAAVIAIVLFVLVLTTVQKGLAVQDSARKIVDDFQVTNDFFAGRTDLTDPATVKKQLQELTTILADLNVATTQDVSKLAAIQPDVRNLLAAGQSDVRIAKQLEGVGVELQGAAGDFRKVAIGADSTVSSVDRAVGDAIDLVNQLNAELSTTERKLAVLPATGGNAK